MTKNYIETANNICKELKIEVKRVDSKDGIIKAKNFTATLKPTKHVIEIK